MDCNAIYPEAQCKFAEIPSLIRSGTDGFLVRTPDEARKTIVDLMGDDGLARAIGAAGAQAAQRHFSSRVIGPKWQAFLADHGISG